MESVRVAFTPEGKLRGFSGERELDIVHGLGPVELLGISLGGCIAVLVASFCERHRLDFREMSVDITMQDAPDKDPPRISQIDVSVSVPHVTSEPERLAIERVAHHCYIHNTLLNAPEINVQLAPLEQLAGSAEEL